MPFILSRPTQALLPFLYSFNELECFAIVEAKEERVQMQCHLSYEITFRIHKTLLKLGKIIEEQD